MRTSASHGDGAGTQGAGAHLQARRRRALPARSREPQRSIADKLIAEQWDFGAPDSYAVGRFPVGWVEYNDTYRDIVRDFWRGQGQRRDLATRVAGSSDIYGSTRRGPDASMNFVTAHDGMTTAWRARLTTRRCGTYVAGTGARCWPRCSSHRA